MTFRQYQHDKKIILEKRSIRHKTITMVDVKYEKQI